MIELSTIICYLEGENFHLEVFLYLFSLKTTSDIIFGTSKNVGDFGIYSNFFRKRTLSPLFNVVKCELISIRTSFHPGATLKLDERENMQKFQCILSKVVASWGKCKQKKPKKLKKRT